MFEDTNLLCCCEYIDIHQQRNHILACCCNCQDLDESFERWTATFRPFIKIRLMTGQTVSPSQVQGFMATFQDRIRIPWYGGARQVHSDILLPVFILPAILLLSTISLWWTITMFSLTSLMLFYLYYRSSRLLRKTKFFLSWTVTSLAVLSLIFEFIVVPLLEILIHENVIVTLIVCACIACVYVVKTRATRLRYLTENQMEIGAYSEGVVGRSYYCPLCQMSIPERDHHCVWFDCCIGFHNRCLFLISIILAIGALLYSSNLTLTTVCHPFRVYKTILLPDDCSDVYEKLELSLAFVSAIYSICMASILSLFLLYEIVLISLGLTGQEWRALPISAKLCCAITVYRPYNKGFFSNWSRITCQKHHQRVACQY